MKLLVLLSLLAAAVVYSGEPAQAEKKETQKEGEELSGRGQLSAKAADAPADAVATLIVFPKKFDIVDPRKAVHVFAKGELARRVEEMLKGKANQKVEFIGKSVAAGIEITQIEAYDGKPKLRPVKVREADATVNTNNGGTQGQAQTPATLDNRPPKLPRGDEEF